MADEMTEARQHFQAQTGVDIMGHATDRNGRFRIKPEDLIALADQIRLAQELAVVPDRRVGFTMPLVDDIPPGKDSTGVTVEPPTLERFSEYQCIACRNPVRPERNDDARKATFTGSITSDMKWTHWDGTPVCQDWVGPLIREAEKRLRQFDAEGRERGLPGPLQRDPSEPIVVEVTWCRHPGTE